MPKVSGVLHNISKFTFNDGTSRYTLQVGELLKGRYIIHDIALDQDKGSLKKYEGMIGKVVEVEAVYGVYQDKNGKARLSVNEA